jgi:hypothetical protein
MTPSMESNEEEGFHAIQRAECTMASAPRQQVHTLLGCESKGFVANGVEILHSLDNALLSAERMNGFGSRPPVAPIRHAFHQRRFLCRVTLCRSSGL